MSITLKHFIMPSFIFVYFLNALYLSILLFPSLCSHKDVFMQSQIILIVFNLRYPQQGNIKIQIFVVSEIIYINFW